MKRRRTPGWYTPTASYYRSAYGGYIDNWSVGHSQGSHAASQTQEVLTMASTKTKVADATASQAAATASTKGKAPKPEASAPRTVEPVSDAALKKLQSAKDAETDPAKRGVLRRQLRAALKSRGEYIPRDERPKSEKAAKQAKPGKTKDAAPSTTKSKKNKNRAA